MDRLPLAEEHPYDPPESEPNPMLALSVKMGIDLTPNGDFEQRLKAVVEGAKVFTDELKQLRAMVKAYEKTVNGLEPVKDCSCAGGTCDECQEPGNV